MVACLLLAALEHLVAITHTSSILRPAAASDIAFGCTVRWFVGIQLLHLLQIS
jgi:hypothetical protein